MVQLSLNFAHASKHMSAGTCMFNVCKTSKKLVCTHAIAHKFDVHTWATEHAQYTRDACHELALGLPHYMCGVATGAVEVDDVMQLFCS